jgi:PAS domain-containing protein
VSTVYHADQQVFLVFTNNITGRKQAEQQIESLARFPGENPNPVLRLRPDGTILYANPASRAILQEWGCAVGQIAPPVWQSAVAAAYTRQASTWLETGRSS